MLKNEMVRTTGFGMIIIRWTSYGNLHRLDGPAYLWSDGECRFYRTGVMIGERIAPQPSMLLRQNLGKQKMVNSNFNLDPII